MELETFWERARIDSWVKFYLVWVRNGFSHKIQGLEQGRKFTPFGFETPIAKFRIEAQGSINLLRRDLKPVCRFILSPTYPRVNLSRGV